MNDIDARNATPRDGGPNYRITAPDDVRDWVADLIDPLVGDNLGVQVSTFPSGVMVVTFRGPRWAIARLVGVGGSTMRALEILLAKATGFSRITLATEAAE